MVRTCRFCCKAPGEHSHLANGTMPPIEIKIEDDLKIAEEAPSPTDSWHVMSSLEPNSPTPYVLRDGRAYQVYRWKCSNILRNECCSCCRPDGVLLPWELTRKESEQMVDGIVIMVDA